MKTAQAAAERPSFIEFCGWAAAEDRMAKRSLSKLQRALPHLEQEIKAQPGHTLLVSIAGLFELGLRLRLDNQLSHQRDLSRASSRLKTSLAGLPTDRPVRTRSARRAISASRQGLLTLQQENC